MNSKLINVEEESNGELEEEVKRSEADNERLAHLKPVESESCVFDSLLHSSTLSVAHIQTEKEQPSLSGTSHSAE